MVQKNLMRKFLKENEDNVSCIQNLKNSTKNLKNI
jgi:hypothetical protein